MTEQSENTNGELATRENCEGRLILMVAGARLSERGGDNYSHPGLQTEKYRTLSLEMFE